MKIGIDIRAIGRQRTGDETYTRELVKSLLKIDKENQYYLYTNTADQEELQKIKTKLELDNNSKAEIVSVLPASKMLWTVWSLPQYLKKNPVDVLHVQYITPQWLTKNIKLVTTIHDLSFLALPEYIKTSDLLFLKTLIPRSLKRADRIIGVSKFTKDEILKYYQLPEEKVVTVYNGVNEKSFKKVTDAEKEEVCQKYKLPEKFLLYVGTFQPRKNIPFLIESFKRLKETYPDDLRIKELQLVLPGNREAYNADKKITQLLDSLKINGQDWQTQIQFPGFIDEDDLSALYQSAQVFVYASMYEGFGLPLIEAMANGVAVIASDSSCHQEIVEQAGIIYPLNNSSQFIDKLFQLLTDERLRMSLVEKGQQRAKEFSWEKAAQETLAIYKSA